MLRTALTLRAPARSFALAKLGSRLPSALHPPLRSPLLSRFKQPQNQVRHQSSGQGGSASSDTVVLGLVSANVLVTIGWMKAQTSSARHPTQLPMKLMLTHFTTSTQHLKEGRYYTLLTAMFSQASLGHLGANMLGLYFFGREISHVLGPRRFLGLYLVGGVLSSAAAVLEQHLSGRLTFNLGASGAVNAITAMSVLLFPHGTLLLFGIVPMPAWLGGSMFIFKDAYSFATDKQDGIGHVAHLSGALVGGLYFYYLRRRAIRNFPFGRF
ncbi:hypothetical protein PF005_g21495 [Phytophthora fragariae]|uniref:Peptidase S54 rhomboid domain-containing protein n=2 Tax=Phytophthora TaxID=4783 RepID=A0A6A3WH38_9STRA|nr:hypothetical protein PF003_g17495 [Phytophthora fragariae]KAE8976297.1 hypothetical protein PR002_g25353 [Phytophthora rubi]KAE8927360.1 hypothetical protein PF009_g22469 [Phytophthora fragariae]KAE8977674.1 hypothetical protein PR001_g25059 [Phytophthora rubi]KAE8985786.1 hypothetical protein PF011_g20254 [Phytophthora fragariae]